MSAHSIPLFKILQWCPISLSVKTIIFTMVHKASSTKLFSCLTLSSTMLLPQWPPQCSSNSLTLGSGIFYLWFPLPPHIDRAHSLTIFRSLLKCPLLLRVSLLLLCLKLNPYPIPAPPILLSYFLLPYSTYHHFTYYLLMRLNYWLFPILEFMLHATCLYFILNF